MIASQYGYTFSQIRQMTMRELSFALRQINYRLGNEMRFDAALAGKQLQAPQGYDSGESQVEFDKKEDDRAEEIMRAAIARKQREHGRP